MRQRVAIWCLAILFSALAVGTVLGAIIYFTNQAGVQNQACIDRKHQYDALHAVIVESFKPQKPSPAILKVFPQLEPLYTPGNPLYEGQRQAAVAQRDRVLGKLGTRPDC